MGYILNFYKPTTLNGTEIRDLFIKDVQYKIKHHIEPYLEKGNTDSKSNHLVLDYIVLDTKYYKKRLDDITYFLDKLLSVNNIYDLDEGEYIEYIYFSSTFKQSTGIKLMLLGEQYNDRYKEGFYEEMDFSCSVDYTDEVFTTLEETLDYVKQFYHCDSDLINIIKFFNDNSNGIAY